MKKLFILISLALAMLFIFCGCSDVFERNEEAPVVTLSGDASQEIPVSADPEDNGYEKSIVFEVVDAEGNKTQKTIETNDEILGDLLQRLELIKGEQGDYGLYIKEVNGITADYETNGTYWAFYINDAYAMSGVDQTPIVDGEVYSFRIEKG